MVLSPLILPFNTGINKINLFLHGSSMSQSILAQVINCEISLQLWQKLQQLHTSQSIARVLELKMQLQTSKKSGSSCAQYIQHMQYIVDCLRSIRSDVSEQDLVLYTLQGLGTDFDNFVTAFSMRSGSITMVELQSLLLSHEARLKANLSTLQSVHLLNSTDAASFASALYAGTSQSRSSFQQHSSTPQITQPPPSKQFSRFSPHRVRGYNRGRGQGQFTGFNSDKPVRVIIAWIYLSLTQHLQVLLPNPLSLIMHFWQNQPVHPILPGLWILEQLHMSLQI
jgi:gag-polypeptide of LTR copia-type